MAQVSPIAESDVAVANVFDEKQSRRIEAVYLTPDIVQQRARLLDALTLQPGERVVDLGCGPGLLALEMARQVGADGAVQCIDSSDSMLALARRRCDGLPHVEVRGGDVAALPYAEHSFDVAVCTQVYEYVPDVDHALAELHRVLKPGGRAAIMDTDWESCVWNSSDPLRMRRVIEAWDMHCPHPQLPRTLAARLRSVGFVQVRVEVIPLINDTYHPETFSCGVIPALAGYAAKQGLVPRAEVDAWVADLQALGERGEYFFSVNRYLFCARKPGEPH